MSAITVRRRRAVVGVAVLAAVVTALSGVGASPAHGVFVRWTEQFGTVGNDTVAAVGSVTNGDVYVLGSTETGIGNGAVVGGASDLYLAKYDQYGTLRWARQFGTEASEVPASTMAVSPNGDVYIAGSTTGAFTSVANAGFPGTHDVFIIKFDRNGNQKWVRQYGSIGDDVALSIARSSIGELYISASTTGVFNSGTRPPNASAGGIDALVLKTNVGGTLRWSYQFGTAGDDRANAVTARGISEVYVVGSTEGDLDGPGSQVHHLGRDAFIMRLDRLGRRNWLRQIGTEAHDELRGVVHDSRSSVYAVGSTSGVLGTLAGYDTQVGPSTSDAIAVRVERAGSTTWINQFGTTGDDSATAVSVGWNGRVYVGGITTGAIAGAVAAGGTDQLLARLPSSGASVVARQFGIAGDDASGSVGTPVNAVRRGRVVFGGATANSLWGYVNAGGADATVTVVSTW